MIGLMILKVKIMKFNDLNKKGVAIHCRLSNVEQSINPNCIIYIYSKDKNALTSQENMLKNYCENWLLKPQKIYKDLCVPNFLSNKSNLTKMLFENSDTDIIISSVDRISRDMKELLDIELLCKEKNIRFFDVSARDFVLAQTLEMYNKKSDDYEL